MYTAVVLNETSRKRLLDEMPAEILSLQGFQMVTEAGEPLVHHVTVNLGDFDYDLNPLDLLGQSIDFVVDSFAFDNKVAAFGVRCSESDSSVFGEPSVRSMNLKPHITIAVNVENKGKPFLSNKLTEWVEMVPVSVSGELVVLD